MDRPNLLFVFTDEQRFDTLGCYGNEKIRTPHTDRLAADSVLFERAYVTQPVCTPSRSSLMTGLWPHQNGCVENNIPLHDDTDCLPEMLPAGMYDSAYMGKWHLGDEIFAQHGFETWVSIDDAYRSHYSEGRDKDARSDYHHWLIAHGHQADDDGVFDRHMAAKMPERFSKPAFLAEKACEYLQARTGSDKPFCLAINFFEPHMPFTSCRDEQYDPAEVNLPANFQDVPKSENPLKTRMFHRAYFDRGFEGIDLQSEDGWRTLIARYWGQCSLVDTHFGRILETLAQTGQADNTIIVYTSDHGDMMGSHRLLAKCVQFEEAVRVPLIIKIPGQHPRRISAPVSQIDLVPTLLELMGTDVPQSLPGRSWKADLEAGNEPVSDVFIQWNGHNNGFGDTIGQVNLSPAMLQVAPAEEGEQAVTDPVRTIVSPDGWKLNASPWRDEHELYNLNDDPHELTNVFDLEAHGDRIAELASRIRSWQQRVDDTPILPDPLA
ncbi:MAG: sulfatase-like hydrolase/transferase [Phycisphaerae bacterium]